MYKNFTTIFDLSQLLRHLINSKAYYPSLINFSSGKPKKISQIIKMIINISKNSGNQNLLNNLHSLEKFQNQIEISYLIILMKLILNL